MNQLNRDYIMIHDLCKRLNYDLESMLTVNKNKAIQLQKQLVRYLLYKNSEMNLLTIADVTGATEQHNVLNSIAIFERKMLQSEEIKQDYIEARKVYLDVIDNLVYNYDIVELVANICIKKKPAKTQETIKLVKPRIDYLSIVKQDINTAISRIMA